MLLVHEDRWSFLLRQLAFAFQLSNVGLEQVDDVALERGAMECNAATNATQGARVGQGFTLY